MTIPEEEFEAFDRLIKLDQLWSNKEPARGMPLEAAQYGREAAMAMICRRFPRIARAIDRYNKVMSQ